MNKKNLLEENSTHQDFIYILSSWAISGLEGKLLTLIETLGLKETQEKAVKDMLRPMLWDWIITSNQSDMFIVEKKKNEGEKIR